MQPKCFVLCFGTASLYSILLTAGITGLNFSCPWFVKRHSHEKLCDIIHLNEFCSQLRYTNPSHFYDVLGKWTANVKQFCTPAKFVSVSEQRAVLTVRHADARIMCILGVNAKFRGNCMLYSFADTIWRHALAVRLKILPVSLMLKKHGFMWLFRDENALNCASLHLKILPWDAVKKTSWQKQICRRALLINGNQVSRDY
jgi:hypothetical protein